VKRILIIEDFDVKGKTRSANVGRPSISAKEFIRTMKALLKEQ
jgi:hypothetical protein